MGRNGGEEREGKGRFYTFLLFLGAQSKSYTNAKLYQ